MFAKRFVLLAAVSALVLVAAPTARAGNGGPKGGGGTSTSSMSLVLLNSTDGVAHWGQDVRFEVVTSATAQPHVDLSCSQGASVVYAAQTGYYDGYPWPWTQTFQLASGAWTGGDADCHAMLYKLGLNGNKTSLATLDFHVFA